ncbi:hypothetical protein SVEN_2983 [Streptomyces venezuelae ATCC 10712]|uniref:Uncharacterized protein n=1 Tax=Streptomyces venezuelae (strain ATCC 10712 / CBS 650.69 / DSM 40230 / JCM 4526 / NBRC 13096 / PD 04745) TaxID=953739 RepID=F2R7I4_STRVP|nr:hypothetical protein SVEN_2983 [Streptomyces venezuelae ATCC 10712]
MDQGVAAAFAGIAGLVGAGLGGLATAYGARIGAQKTIEAVQVQVSQQASVEHEHWVREQRRQACDDIATAWVPFMTTSANCLARVSLGNSPSNEQLSELHQAFVGLAATCAKPPLWGPNELIRAAQDIVATTQPFSRSLSTFRGTLDSGDQEAIDAHKIQVDAKFRDTKAVWHAFTRVTRDVLGTPS